MANLSYCYLTLDTLAPVNVALVINGGVNYTATPTIPISISCEDSVTTGYSMKVWGIKGAETEAEATWETFSTSKQVTLTDGDGVKTIYVKVRDDVYNESAAISSTITLNTTIPVVSIKSQDVTKISKVAPKNVATLTWFADSDFKEYKVCLVSSINATHDSGVVIATTNGSTNTSGTSEVSANTEITTTINGADFETAGAISNEQSIVKIFVKNTFDTWSK